MGVSRYWSPVQGGEIMSLICFWTAVCLLAYTAILFPILTILRGVLFRKPYKEADNTPNVTMVVAAYNEEKNIGEKIENILSLDYPKQKLEVLIASDGSTDQTEEIVRSYANQGIKLLALPRQGKQATLNDAVPFAHGDILVFSDANNAFARDAIRALVRPFGDPHVGGVAGNQTYLTGGKETGTNAECSYWNFDQMLKHFQSEAGNVTSATGSIYAIWCPLFRKVPPGVPDDFFISTNVIAQGSRLVYARKAVCYEPVTQSSDKEFKRKVRIITQGLYSVLLMKELLNPLRYGFYALQLFSHKFLRRLMYIPLMIVLLANPFLWNDGYFYKLTMLAQLGFYGGALLGLLLKGRLHGKLKILTMPFYFCMTYFAAMLATLNLFRGYRISVWETQRQETVSPSKLAH